MTPFRFVLASAVAAAAWAGSMTPASAQFADSNFARRHAFDGYDGVQFGNVSGGTFGGPYLTFNPYAGAAYDRPTDDWFYDRYSVRRTPAPAPAASYGRIGTARTYPGYGFDGR